MFFQFLKLMFLNLNFVFAPPSLSFFFFFPPWEVESWIMFLLSQFFCFFPWEVEIQISFSTYMFSFYKKNFDKKMSLKNLKKILRKSSASDDWLKFWNTLIFPRALQKLQKWENSDLFSYFKLFCFSIIKKTTFIISVKPN